MLLYKLENRAVGNGLVIMSAIMYVFSHACLQSVQINCVSTNSFTNVMVLCVNVLCSWVCHRVSCNTNGSFIVLHNHRSFDSETWKSEGRYQIQVASWIAQLKPTYSASVVDSVRFGCFLLDQQTGPWLMKDTRLHAEASIIQVSCKMQNQHPNTWWDQLSSIALLVPQCLVRW